jgi:hypothetical protein
MRLIFPRGEHGRLACSTEEERWIVATFKAPGMTVLGWVPEDSPFARRIAGVMGFRRLRRDDSGHLFDEHWNELPWPSDFETIVGCLSLLRPATRNDFRRSLPSGWQQWMSRRVMRRAALCHVVG